ncbi:peptidase domain-containing ABC transporter [Shewanella colwelliana]|uniref:peptidase domain-containing ABC transporter n=1 Tax=Shewanella colwelliana TaxID=23 RepID=UPI0022AF6800|nr:peptidase domain-containing ABC transporter [Shewanella colwelliana]MCZ4337688.1 peptidase domain-containing ABC transporter [Shewanella colwelliana]
MEQLTMINEPSLSFSRRRKLPMIMQSEASECGLACLAMVCGYHGNNSSLHELRRKLSVPKSGLSITDLMRFAEHLNLTSRPFKLDLNGLSQLKTPCVLFWNMEHYVVLKSVTKDKVILHDPAYGVRKLTMEEVSQSFTGVAIEFSPTTNFTQKHDSQPALKFSDLWSSVKGLKGSLALILLLSALIQVFSLIAPYYIQLVVDKVLFTSDELLLQTLAIGFGLMMLFNVASGYLRSLALVHLSNAFNFQLGANLFRHLIRLPVSFFEKRHMGDVVSKFSSLSVIREQMTNGIVETIIDGLMALSTLILIFFYSPLLSMIVVLATLLYAALRLGLYPKYRRVNEQELIAVAEENSNFMETLRGIETVKAFGSEPQREALWQNYQAHSVNKNIQMGHFQNIFTTSQALVFGLENITLIYLGAMMVVDTQMSIGMLFAYLTYKRLFTDRITNLIEKWIEFKMLGLHFHRLSDIALEEPEEDYAALPTTAEIAGGLSINALSFRYDSASPLVLENVSFEVLPGESVAIVGPSGRGKSTLFKLLLGFHKPVSGNIEVDGVELNRFGSRNFRQQVAVVMQEDSLFSGTIADNIGLFESPVNMDHVIACAKVAQIHDDILRMPQGYDSLIGDMGAALSGGQRQRIVLARALYKRPKILFLDEATSHLDSALERKINSAIGELNITRIIIAHRIETIESAGRVIQI